MRTTLIIGAGGVSRVVVYKCVQNAEVFGKIVLASRTKSKCDEIRAELPNADIDTVTLNADNTPRGHSYKRCTTLSRPNYYGCMY